MTTDPEKPSADNSRRRVITLVETWVALLITLASVHLHMMYMLHAGGLWRDEAASFEIAAQTTLSEMWQMLLHEAFPGLLHVMVRAWVAIGLGNEDLHLRWLGFGIGIALLAAFWLAAWLMRRGVPIFPLALLALNLTFIRTVDSLRAYGLGSALVILALTLLWLFVRKPTLGNGLTAALAAVLSVQCLYQNAFFIFAACCGACAVCIWERQWRKALCIVSFGALAAVSLLPYLGKIVQAQEHYMTFQTLGFQPALAWYMASALMGFPMPWFAIVWLILVVLGIWAALRSLSHSAKASPVPETGVLALYAMVSMGVGLAGFILFLKIASLPTQVWYYTPLLTFIAVCLDAMLTEYRPWTRLSLILVAVRGGSAADAKCFHAISYRQTNIDLLAAQLGMEAGAGDLVIVHPFYCGTTFYRYYKGRAPWTTLPPLEDYRVQRYDLFKAKMQTEHAIQPVLDKVAATLQSGHRVWLVGWIPLDGSPPPEMHSAPNNPWGWDAEAYSDVWGAIGGYFMVTHARQIAVVVDPSGNRVNPLENLPLFVVTGWRDQTATPQFEPSPRPSDSRG